MSWDVSIIKFSTEYKSIDDIPEDEKPLPLGSRDFIHKTVLEYFPGTDWSDAQWGIFDSKYGSVEFNIGKDDPVDDMMLHIRASEEIVSPIVDMCRKMNWSAVDYSSGNLLEHTVDPARGLKSWRRYLNQVLGK